MPSSNSLPPELIADIREFTAALRSYPQRRAEDEKFKEEVIEKLAILPHLQESIDSFNKVMFKGNGVPSMVTRVALLEERARDAKRAEDEEDKARSNGRWGIAIAIITVLGGLVAAGVGFAK